MAEGECQAAHCTDPADVDRQVKPSGRVLSYCEAHDPLADGTAAWAFAEVPEDE